MSSSKGKDREISADRICTEVASLHLSPKPKDIPLPLLPITDNDINTADLPDQSLESMLEEAIDTSLPPASSITPISPLPRAHYPSTMSASAFRPRLLSQISRSTLPTSSLTYAQARDMQSGGSGGDMGYPYAESSAAAARRRVSLSASAAGMGFPDLDPMTGLPLMPAGEASNLPGGNGDPDIELRAAQNGQNGLQLQRTITGLLKSPTQSMPSVPSPFSGVGLPKMPALPSMSISMPGLGWQKQESAQSSSMSRRSMSTSSAQNDWGWGWWSGNKGKVDQMMSEEDQADTVDEEREKLKRKCRSDLSCDTNIGRTADIGVADLHLQALTTVPSSPGAPLTQRIDRTPKRPMVFCHGLLGFDYLGPTSLPPLQISHWRGIREVLESNGVDVLITRVPATASIADRAAILAETIAEKYEGQEVNLIGHSMVRISFSLY